MTAGKFSFFCCQKYCWMATFTSVPKAHCFSRFTSCYHLRCLSSWNPLRETETGTWTRSWTAGPSQRSWIAPWTSCLAQVWSLTQFFSLDFSRIGLDKSVICKPTIKVYVSRSLLITQKISQTKYHKQFDSGFQLSF